MPNPTDKKHIPVKKVDLKAPRFGKAGFTCQAISRELHKEWMRESGYDISYEEFFRIWLLIAKEIILQVTTTTHGVKLPFYNGSLSLNYVEMLRAVVSAQKSQAMGYQVPCLDWHSDGRLGKVVMRVGDVYHHNRWVKYWAFSPCRPLARMAKDAFTNHPDIFRFNRTTHYTATKLLERNDRL